MSKKFTFLMFAPLIFFSLTLSTSAELPDQVMIEIKVVELMDVSGEELGIRWGYDRGEHRLNNLPANWYQAQSQPDEIFGIQGPNKSSLWEGTFNLPIPYSDRGIDLLFDRVKIGRTVLDLRLQALISEGKAKLLANPKIVTINGKKATFVAGDEIPFQTIKLVQAQSIITTEFRTAGVTLNVTPTIQEKEYVLLEVEPQVSAVSGYQDVMLGSVVQDQVRVSTLPIFSIRKAQTTVLVKDGGTLVLGGLYQNNVVKHMEKVPFLGDIPFLGLLFRYTKDSVRKTELVIFVSPHIISAGESTSEIIPESLKKEFSPEIVVPEFIKKQLPSKEKSETEQSSEPEKEEE